MSVLVYVGANYGHSLATMVDGFDSVYAFEPNPTAYNILKDRFQNKPWVTLFNVACAEENGTAPFFNTPNHESSSLSPVDVFEPVYSDLVVSEVETVNLHDILDECGVHFIDHYQSDIQGYDLTVLKTIKDFIDEQRIETLFVETWEDDAHHYQNVENGISAFHKLLSPNYICEHISVYVDGAYVQKTEIPAGCREFDSFWRKNSEL